MHPVARPLVTMGSTETFTLHTLSQPSLWMAWLHACLPSQLTRATMPRGWHGGTCVSPPAGSVHCKASMHGGYRAVVIEQPVGGVASSCPACVGAAVSLSLSVDGLAAQHFLSSVWEESSDREIKLKECVCGRPTLVAGGRRWPSAVCCSALNNRLARSGVGVDVAQPRPFVTEAPK